MDYFTKVKNASLKAAQQGMNLIHTVTIVAHDIGITPSFAPRKPVDDFLSRFQIVLNLLDQFAKMENSNSAEAERMLNESKVHDHIKEMLKHLQAEDELWVNSHVQKSEDAIRELPCLEVFLQNHIMEELCTRAKRDKPRGCLPLVLAIATSILRTVRYPLLPHQAVHKSLCQLITNSSTLSSKYSGMAKNMPHQKGELNLYIRRIDMNLVAMVSALWKRISENPELLAFFRFIDTSSKVKQQLDALSCLIPLMGKPKVGIVAKEAFLVAVAMRDYRVNRYILQETNLVRNIINELCKKYSSSVSSASTLTALVPATLGSTRVTPLPDSNSNSGLDSSTSGLSSSSHGFAASKAVLKPTASYVSTSVEPFLKVLRFCSAFVSTSSAAACSLRDVSTGSTPTKPDPRGIDPTCSESLQGRICSHFKVLFLEECVKPHLLESGELPVLIAQSLFRFVLLELSPASSTGRRGAVGSSDQLEELSAAQGHVLCPLATALICEDKELIVTLISRAVSVSRTVSVSTMQLLNTLLGAVTMTQACQLVVSADYGTIPSPDPFAPSSPPTPSPRVRDIDSTLSTVIASASSKFGSISWIGRVDETGRRPSTRGLPTPNYTEAALDRLLSRLAGSLSHLHNQSSSLGHNQPDDRFATPTGKAVFSSPSILRSPLSPSGVVLSNTGGPLFDLMKKKLALFLTLKYDEQVAVSGLVERCVTILCTLLVLSDSDVSGSMVLHMLMDVFKLVTELIKELLTHMKRVPEVDKKLEVVLFVLSDPAQCDPRRRKVVENENPQVIRILEAVLLVRELYREVEGAIVAVTQLRAVIFPGPCETYVKDGDTPLSVDASPALSVDSFETVHRSPITFTPPRHEGNVCDVSSPSPLAHMIQKVGIQWVVDDARSESDESGGDPNNEEGEDCGGDGEYMYLNEETFLRECDLLERDLAHILEKGDEGQEEQDKRIEGEPILIQQLITPDFLS